jgi:hypothetical protein
MQTRTQPNATLDGKIEKVPLNKLLVDHDYQRSLREKFVAEAKKDFQPILIGVPEVSRRADGTNFVLDGQHRIELLKVMGFKAITCHVHDGLSQQQEAYFFRFYNRKRAQITAYEDYRAALVEGEHLHLEIEKIVTGRGLKVAQYSSTKTISSVWQLRKMIGYGSNTDMGNPSRLARVLDLSIGSWANEPNLFEGEVLDALFYMVRKYDKLDDAHAIKRWGAKWTPKRLLNAGHDAKYTYGISKTKGMTEQLIVAYDWRLANGNKLRPDEV